MTERTALVFGSTGLVGNHLVGELVASGKWNRIKIFVRNPTGLTIPGVEEVITDLSSPEELSPMIKGDDLFICIGTTIKKAGTVSNMERIDRDLPVSIAGIAALNGIKRIAVVSSIGASASSANYYLRIKGEMEDGILATGIPKKVIVRPSLLLGDRREKRAGELVGKVMMMTFGPVLRGKLRKYRAIHGRDVARAMIILLDRETGSVIFESDELQRASRE